ncbi:GL10803 [Drosophila persimilis]|nr:GL10803 [Drosophila persimilis]
MLNLKRNPICLHQDLQVLAVRQTNIYMELPEHLMDAADEFAAECSNRDQHQDHQAGTDDTETSDWANSARTSQLDTTDESSLENRLEDLSVMLPAMSRYITSF